MTPCFFCGRCGHDFFRLCDLGLCTADLPTMIGLSGLFHFFFCLAQHRPGLSFFPGHKKRYLNEVAVLFGETIPVLLVMVRDSVPRFAAPRPPVRVIVLPLAPRACGCRLGVELPVSVTGTRRVLGCIVLQRPRSVFGFARPVRRRVIVVSPILCDGPASCRGIAM